MRVMREKMRVMSLEDTDVYSHESLLFIVYIKMSSLPACSMSTSICLPCFPRSDTMLIKLALQETLRIKVRYTLQGKASSTRYIKRILAVCQPGPEHKFSMENNLSTNYSKSERALLKA